MFMTTRMLRIAVGCATAETRPTAIARGSFYLKETVPVEA